MGLAVTLQGQRRGCILKCAAVAAVIVLITAAGAAQAAGQPEMPWTQDLKKYPQLQTELEQLIGKLQKNVQMPAPRGPSRLLPLLPESTVFYAAIPNYGDASHQALAIFQQELLQSPSLRDWWQHGELAATGPKLEDSLEKFYQLSQYLGDEIVVSAATGGRPGPSLLILAEVKKPGLKEFLQQRMKELPSKPPLRVLDVQELAATKDGPATQEPVVLVRPDFVVLALDVAALRSFSARLDHNQRPFASTLFGQRVAHGYEGGAEFLVAADLQKILKQIPVGNNPSQKMFERSGFAEMKYLIWEHKTTGGQATSEAELSFTGPRRGVASWLAAPAPLGSLDFVSPQAILASAVRLKNLGEIFDDVQDLATASNPAAFAMLAQMQQGMGLNLKDDLLSQLAGEITVELDSANPSTVNPSTVNPPTPAWKAILQVKDAAHLQMTLNKLLATAPVMAQQHEEGGVTYHSLRMPSPQKAFEIDYAFVDGYLIFASSHEALAEAVRLHRSGESLAKSRKLLESLPPGHSSEASALLYEDPMAMMGLRIRQASPEMADSLSQMHAETTPAVVCAYGEPSAIREASRSGGVDPAMVMVAAAIAIPNLMRAKMAANESSAVGSVRVLVTAQIAYSTTYRERGFAPDLATLGPASGGTGSASADHAGLVDAALANASCAGDTWCTKSGFRFRMTAVCRNEPCKEFVAVGTPATSNDGTRSFCATSDGVIRFKVGTPLTSAISAAECRGWPPLQ